jgi:hypothetical protein
MQTGEKKNRRLYVGTGDCISERYECVVGSGGGGGGDGKVRSYKSSDKPLGSIKCGELLDWLKTG